MENRETIEVEDLGGEMERPAQNYGPVKKKKNEFKKGFLSGVAASLAAVLILGAVGSMVLTSNGYVFTTFKPDKNLTGGILSESVETKLSAYSPPSPAHRIPRQLNEQTSRRQLLIVVPRYSVSNQVSVSDLPSFAA